MNYNIKCLDCLEQGKVTLRARKAERVASYEAAPTLCEHCKKSLPYKGRDNKFCNRSCAAAFNNKGVRRHGLPLRACLNCSKPTKSPYRIYCSNACKAQYVYNEYIKRWLDGVETGMYRDNETVSGQVKKWLGEQRGFKCEQCQWCEVNSHTGKMPLQVHHKDGSCENNQPDNLVLLCPNCHSLTENYGGANRGSGRRSRKSKRKAIERVKCSTGL